MLKMQMFSITRNWDRDKKKRIKFDGRNEWASEREKAILNERNSKSESENSFKFSQRNWSVHEILSKFAIWYKTIVIFNFGSVNREK